MNSLITFIQSQLNLGVSREVITAQLLGQGWKKLDIDQAFISLEVPLAPVPTPPISNLSMTSVPISNSSPIPQTRSVYNTISQNQPQPKKSKSLPTLVILVVVLCVIGGVAYYYFNKIDSSKIAMKQEVSPGDIKSNNQNTNNPIVNNSATMSARPTTFTDLEYSQQVTENIKPSIISFGENLVAAGSMIENNDGINALVDFKKAQSDISKAQNAFQTLQGRVPPDMAIVNDLFKKTMDIYTKGVNLYVTATTDYNTNGKQTASTYVAQLQTASGYITQGNSYLQQATMTITQK